MADEQFISKLTRHNGGLRQQRRLRQIWEAAGQSIGCRSGPGMQLEAELIVEGLHGLQEQISRVEQAIEQLAAGFPEYEYLKSIPGLAHSAWRCRIVITIKRGLILKAGDSAEERFRKNQRWSVAKKPKCPELPAIT